MSPQQIPYVKKLRRGDTFDKKVSSLCLDTLRS